MLHVWQTILCLLESFRGKRTQEIPGEVGSGPDNGLLLLSQPAQMHQLVDLLLQLSNVALLLYLLAIHFVVHFSALGFSSSSPIDSESTKFIKFVEKSITSEKAKRREIKATFNILNVTAM